LSGISGASYDQTKDLLEKIDVVPTEKLKGDEQKLGAVVADVEMLAVCLSVCLFVCLSVCLFVCLSVCLFILLDFAAQPTLLWNFRE